MEEHRTVSPADDPFLCQRRTVTLSELGIMQITYHVDYQYKLPGDDRPVASGSVMRSSSSVHETSLRFLSEEDYMEISVNPM